jgi:hypothetical protein
MAGRRDLKSVTAMNDKARHQRGRPDVDDARTRLESALQSREIGVAPLPSRNFDTNSARRQVDDERAGRSAQWCSSGVRVA